MSEVFGGDVPILTRVKPSLTLTFDGATRKVEASFKGFPTRMALTVCHLLPDGSVIVVMEPEPRAEALDDVAQ